MLAGDARADDRDGRGKPPLDRPRARTAIEAARGRLAAVPSPPSALGRVDSGNQSYVDVRVPLDRRAHVVWGADDDPRAVVYLPGHCGNDLAFTDWATAARPHGTLVALLGDIACPGQGRFRWGPDLATIDHRIVAALAAVGAARGRRLDSDVVTLVGYSEGALRAEGLAHRFPGRYRVVALAGLPRPPRRDKLEHVRAAAVVAGEWDRARTMREATGALAAAGLPARFFELPGARHGEYGPDGTRVLGEALQWLAERRDAR